MSTTKAGPNAPVDFVINFSIAPTKATSADSKAKSTQAIEEEYLKLLGVLKDAGLEAKGRSGGQGTDSVLIFVRASEERVQAEIQRERLSDWLNGVATTRPSPRTPRDFSAEPIHSSERLRLVYAILTSTSKGSDVSTPPPPPLGLTPLPHPPSFPRVTAIFPPQDLAFNSNWLKKWSSASHIVSIPPEELTSIKDHFGETVALYFAFLRFYFFALIFPATMGVVFWLAGLEFNGIYAIGIVGWSVIFVESWRLKEQELAVEWGTYGVHKVEKQRPEFKGESKVVDPITGVERDYFPWYQTSARELATIPLFLVFATALACLISVIYAIETVVEEVYSGAGKKYLALVPTVLFAGVVPQFTALWDCTAARLTGWENHRKQTNYARSLALKVFGLNFFVAYGSLILTSYIYIPFGGFLVPWILSFIPQHEASFSSSAAYSIDTSKLHTQIIAFTLTDQITEAFMEIGLPAVTHLLTRKSPRSGRPDPRSQTTKRSMRSSSAFATRRPFPHTTSSLTTPRWRCSSGTWRSSLSSGLSRPSGRSSTTLWSFVPMLSSSPRSRNVQSRPATHPLAPGSKPSAS